MHRSHRPNTTPAGYLQSAAGYAAQTDSAATSGHWHQSRVSASFACLASAHATPFPIGCNTQSTPQNRAEYYNLITIKYINQTCKELDNDYFKSFDDVNDRQIQNNWRNHLLYNSHFSKLSNSEKQIMIMSSGINNLEYTVIERKMIHDIVELIKVDI